MCLAVYTQFQWEREGGRGGVEQVDGRGCF